MSENDSLRELAEAGEAVFGTDDEQLLALFEHRCWKGSCSSLAQRQQQQ
jgi:hypothetical protein